MTMTEDGAPARATDARKKAFRRLVRLFSWTLLYWVVGFVACMLLGQPAYAIAVAAMFFIDVALLITFRRMLRQAQNPTP